MWMLLQEEKLPRSLNICEKIKEYKISGKRTIVYHDSCEHPMIDVFTYDHPHCMAKAVKTTCALGFMLKDLNQEFAARYADNLCLSDKNAKTLGSLNITNRATMGAFIGEGNKHFFKYSLLGSIYLFITMTLEKSIAEANNVLFINRNERILDIITKPALYRRIGLFSGIISPTRLARIARITFKQFENDYKIASFLHLIEWRCKRRHINCTQISPVAHEYKTIVTEKNCFRPHVCYPMKQNSELLSQHLASLLRLKYDREDNMNTPNVDEEYLSDQEILSYATQHNLPLTISIDGSFNSEEGIATTTICITAPDIRETDPPDSDIWQYRCAKVLLIRSWRLPKKWGTGKATINLAESIGFILGAYTAPLGLPILHVTDSANARTLQRNVRHMNDFTLRKQMRTIIQGINSAVANHLEYLTAQWPDQHQDGSFEKQLYDQGLAWCNACALQPGTSSRTHSINFNAYNMVDSIASSEVIYDENQQL
jgi:hypothetical protein